MVLTSGSGFSKPQKNIPKAPSKATHTCIFRAVIAPCSFLQIDTEIVLCQVISQHIFVY